MDSNNVDKTGQKILSAFALTMITVGSVDSIRNLPSIALFGAPLILFFTAAAILFLVPSVLISAELVATWPEHHGAYGWTRHAFGQRLGFLSIWLQWIGNVIWYPTILSFTAVTIGYLISPTLAENKTFLITIILGSFWGITVINLYGMKCSAFFSSFCTIFGLLLPMIIIIGLGAVWLFSGHQSQITITPQSIVPNIKDPQMWIALTGIIMSFCGMEVATVHSMRVKEPQRAFPRALFISMSILIVTIIFGSLTIAEVVPGNQIDIIAGIMQTFQKFFALYNLQWIMPIIGIIVVIGTIGGVNNWVIAPTTGLAVAARDGNLPSHFAKTNKKHAPHILLIYQAILVTLLMLVFLYMPSVSGSYWLLTALATQLYMGMYILMFAAALYLRFKHPDYPRPFRIPGRKNSGMILVASIGIIGASIAFVIGFVPPMHLQIGSIFHYEAALITGLILAVLPPIIIHHYNHKRDLVKQLQTVAAEEVAQ